MNKQTSKDMLQAGTGFMISLSDAIHRLEEKGFTDNLSAHYDHLECRSGSVKLYPKDFSINHIVRFENSSDPDDQSILYAIESNDGDVKGVYVESYGLYHDEQSKEMIEKLKDHPH